MAMANFIVNHSSTSGLEDNIPNVNLTAGDDENDDLDVLRIIWVAAVIGLICLAAVGGNILVMIAYSQDAKIQNTVSNLFILNMSIADCLVGLVVLPVHTTELLLDYWPFGKIFCQLYISLDYSTSLVSILMVTLISLDRYWLVTKKIRYRDFQTRRQVKTMIAVCWLCVFGFYLTVAFAWEPIVGETVIDYAHECDLAGLYNATFSTTMLFVEFVVPLSMIVTFNIIVYSNISRRARGLPKKRKQQEIPQSISESVSSKLGDNNGSDSDITQTTTTSKSASCLTIASTNSKQSIKSKNHSEKETEFRRHRKAAITLAVIVVIFVICLLPYYVTSIWFQFCEDEDCISDLVWMVANYVLWCNASINPFLYALTIIHFRRNFYRLLGIAKSKEAQFGTKSETSVM